MSPRSATRIFLVSLTLGLGLFGCSQPHLSPNYAVSYKGWFLAQRAGAPGDHEVAQRALNQLDAQEAAGISANYRHNVSKETTPNGQGQMLMIGQSRAPGAEAYMPPPSVPVAQ